MMGPHEFATAAEWSAYLLGRREVREEFEALLKAEEAPGYGGPPG